MDDLKSLHILRMRFPNHPYAYLVEMYEKHQKNLPETITKIGKMKKKGGSSLKTFLLDIVSLVCGCYCADSDVKDEEAYFTGENLRAEATVAYEKKQFYMEQLRTAKPEMVSCYRELVRMEQEKVEQLNNMAAAAFYAENRLYLSDETLDLHCFYRKEAVTSLDIFLDRKILEVRDMNLRKMDLEVITGKGLHSKGKVSVLKPVVIERLKSRGMGYTFKNGGCLEVLVQKHSLLTTEFKNLPEGGAV